MHYIIACFVFQISESYKNLQRKLKGNWKTMTNGSGGIREDGQATISLDSLMQVSLSNENKTGFQPVSRTSGTGRGIR